MKIEASHIPDLARGCAILGTGGGGDVANGILVAQHALTTWGPVELTSLDDLPDDGIVMPVGYIGAPSVSIEKLGSGEEINVLRAAVEEALGRPVVALMVSEIGGGNGLQPVAWAARSGLPLLDADGIGRAFPEVQMVSMNVAGRHPDLLVVADERGNVALLRPVDGRWAETMARAVAESFGGSGALADYVMTVENARGAVIEGSVTKALAIGRVASSAQHPVPDLVTYVDGVRLIEGKVVDVERVTAGGFVRGSTVIEGYGVDAGRLVRLEIQNENLVVFEDGALLASVPDLISVLDSQTADAIATEVLRYGQRVVVIAFPCDPIWRSPRGIEIAGPRAFGYDIDYTPVDVLHG